MIMDLFMVFQVIQYCGKEASKLADMVSMDWVNGSPALSLRNDVSPHVRACIEAILTWQVVDAQLAILENKNLLRIYAGM